MGDLFSLVQIFFYANYSRLFKKTLFLIVIISVLLSFTFVLPIATYYQLAPYRYGNYDYLLNGDFSVALADMLVAREDIYHLVPAFTLGSQIVGEKGDRTYVEIYYTPDDSINDLWHSKFSKENLLKGRYPLHTGEIAISSLVARGQNLSVGDEVTIQFDSVIISLPAKIVGIYSLLDSGSAVAPVSRDVLNTLVYNYNMSLEEIFIQSGYLEKYPLLKSITYNWMWITTDRNEAEMHNLLNPLFPEDNTILLLSRKKQEQQALEWLEFTPPVVTTISLIGLVALSILCHREAVSSKEVYGPVQALLGLLGAKQKMLRMAFALYEGSLLLFSSVIAYYITINFNLGLFFNMDFPRILRPLLMQAQVVICILVLAYSYFFAVVRTRKQLNVLTEFRWEL